MRKHKDKKEQDIPKYALVNPPRPPKYSAGGLTNPCAEILLPRLSMLNDQRLTEMFREVFDFDVTSIIRTEKYVIGVGVGDMMRITLDESEKNAIFYQSMNDERHIHLSINEMLKFARWWDNEMTTNIRSS